jgi:hypothetical protein
MVQFTLAQGVKQHPSSKRSRSISDLTLAVHLSVTTSSFDVYFLSKLMLTNESPTGTLKPFLCSTSRLEQLATLVNYKELFIVTPLTSNFPPILNLAISSDPNVLSFYS